MKLYNTANSHNNRNGVNTKARTSNSPRHVSQFNENKEETSTNSTLNRLELHSNLTVNFPEDYLPYATGRSRRQTSNNNNNNNLKSSELNSSNESENMTKQRTVDQANNSNVIESSLPYFTWEDLSNRSDQEHSHRGKRMESNRLELSVDNVLTGASNSPIGGRRENNSTKNQINNNNNFNSNLSANYQNFHADRELEEEVELFEDGQTELREQTDDMDYEDDNSNDGEILAGYTRNGTLQSSNYLHNTLGHRLLMIDSARSTATVTSLHQQLEANNRALNDDTTGGIINQSFIGLHSCYGYPKCENLNCGNCNKAHLTANLGDHINTSSSSWFSVSSQSRTFCSLGCCAILTTCFFILLAIVSVVGISIYLCNITNLTKSNILPLSGRFKVQSGDHFNELLYNVSSREFQIKATKYEAILQSAMQGGTIEDSVVNAEVHGFRKGSLVVFFRVYLDRRKLMQDYELRLLPNVNHKLIGLDSLEPRKPNEKEEEWLVKLVQNRIKYGIGQLNLIGTDSLVFLTNSILVSLNYTDPLLNQKDDHFANERSFERLQSDKILGSRSDTERTSNNLMNFNSVYGTNRNKTLKGRIGAGSNDRKEHVKAVKKVDNTISTKNSKGDQQPPPSSSTTTQPSTTKPSIVEMFTNTPSYITANKLKQTITMRPVIQRYTTQSSLIEKFNHSSLLYTSPAHTRPKQKQNSRPLDRSQQLLNSFSSLLTDTLTTSTTTTTSAAPILHTSTTSSRPLTSRPSTSRTLHVDESSSEPTEWTTIEPFDKITNKKAMSLHTESPISIYLKLKQIRKQLMANSTQATIRSMEKNVDRHIDRNTDKHDRHEDKSNSSVDQNQDASNVLRSHEAISGGFSPLTTIPVHNRSNAHTNKDKYLSIINNSFKSQSVNIVTVSPLPPNHKLPLPTTSVHISSLDLAPWRPVSPFNHKSDLYSMFKSNRLTNSTQQVNKNPKNGTTSTNSSSQQTSTTSKPKANLKPINPSLPPKAYTPPTISIGQHIHRKPSQLNKNHNFNKNKHLGHPNMPSNANNNRTPMNILNLRNEPFGHRPSSSNTIQNTALPNGLMTNFNMNNLNNNNKNNNNWLMSRPPQLDPNSPLFGQPLSDTPLESMDQLSFGSFNNFNNPLGSFDEIPSMLRREDSETTIAPAAFHRESRTNMKNNQRIQANSRHLTQINKEQIDLETLLGLTESFKLNSSIADNDKFFDTPVTPPSSASTASMSQNMNRFQKRIGIVDREFIDEEYFKSFTRRLVDQTSVATSTKPSIELNEINLDLNNSTSIDDPTLTKDKFDNQTTYPPTVKDDDLRLNNFNDDVDLIGELPKFNGDGLIEMTTTVKDETFLNEIKKTDKPTTLSLQSDQYSTLSISTLIPTTPTPEQIECDPFNEFGCTNGKQCVNKSMMCDMEINCSDRSDESNCSCADYLTRFNQQKKMCDGIMDCFDQSDELNCDYCKLTNSSNVEKANNVFICPNAKFCIRKDQVCDGFFDCPSGSDEEFCVSLAHKNEVIANTLNSANQQSSVKTYQDEGVLVIRRNGEWAPLCLENSDVVSSLFGSQSSAAYDSLNSRSFGESSTESNSNAPDLIRTNNKLFKGLSADTIQGENGDLIVANSNTATLSAYSMPTSTTNRASAQPVIYPSRPWFEDESSYSWQLDELGKAVCSLASFNELDSINVTNLSSRGKQLSEVAGDRLKYYSMNQQNIMSRNSNAKWGNLFKSDTCLSGKIASIRCKEFECGVRPSSNNVRKRIIGGQSSRPLSWPWMVALYKEGSYQCGGVLIGHQWLLSAAHCFQSSRKAYWTARLGVLRRGSHFENPFEQLIRISHIIIHPDYADNKGFLNDIVLLKLEKPVKYSDYVRPLCLPDSTESSDLYDDKLCSIVGWGKLYENHPDTLQELKIPVISTEECRRRTILLPLYKISDSQICAGWPRGGRDACLGDSGGPLMCPTSEGKWSLIGITSNGDGCGRPGRPGIYTKVVNFVDWIEKEMAKERPVVPVDYELIEKYTNKEILDELKLFNGNREDYFLNAEFVLSDEEKQKLMEQNIRNFDKNSRIYTNNLRIAPDFKTPTANSRTIRRMALANERRIPRFIEQGEIINVCHGFRCPLGKCLNITQVCNNRIDCRDGSDEKGC